MQSPSDAYYSIWLISLPLVSLQSIGDFSSNCSWCILQYWLREFAESSPTWLSPLTKNYSICHTLVLINIIIGNMHIEFPTMVQNTHGINFKTGFDKNRVHRKEIILYEANPMSGVFRNIDPPPTSPFGDCVPPAFGAGGGHTRRVESVWLSTSWGSRWCQYFSKAD